MIAALHSAHVCRIHDTGTVEDGSPFIVMDRLVGDDLDQVLRRTGPLPIAVAVDYVLQACDAIAEAHLNGVVHRDIKPSNLFLATTTEGEMIKVLDFGIAKARRTDLKSLTGTGTVLGSPYYMPPEQLVDSREVHAAADIWALGVTLFELVSAQPCFHGKDVGELFTAVLRDEPIPLSQVRPDAPAALGEVIARCLQKLPADRPASVAELATALEPFGTDRARVLAHRIRGLTFRRSAKPGTDAPTGVLQGGATLVEQGYHPPGPTIPSSPGYLTQLGPPAGPHAGSSYVPTPTGQGLASPVRPRGRRWGLAVAGTLLAVGIAAAGTFAVMNGDGAGESSSSPSSARKGPPSCSANRCTLALADLDVLAHDVAIAQVAALIPDRVAGKKAGMYMLNNLGVDGTLTPSTMLWIHFYGTSEVVTTIVSHESTNVIVQPLGAGVVPPGDLSGACPARSMLAEVRRRHPETERVNANLLLAAGARWSLSAATSGGGTPAWALLLAEDCAPP